MLTRNDLKEIIEDTVIHNIDNFFHGKKVKTTHMLDHIFPRERKIRSLIGGLETSMGTRVWEPLAKSFAARSGYKVLDEDRFNSRVPIIPQELLNFIAHWEEKKLRNPTMVLSRFSVEVKKFIGEHINRNDLEFSKIPKGQGVDVILLKDNTYYFFDLKTTQLNAGGGPKFLHNLLCWYTYAALLDIENITCFLAFPFDPHKGNFWQREGGKILPLIPREEAFVGDEFWDVLTEIQGTTEIIESTFKKLGNDGFGAQFSHHFD